MPYRQPSFIKIRQAVLKEDNASTNFQRKEAALKRRVSAKVRRVDYVRFVLAKSFGKLGHKPSQSQTGSKMVHGLLR